MGKNAKDEFSFLLAFEVVVLKLLLVFRILCLRLLLPCDFDLLFLRNAKIIYYLFVPLGGQGKRAFNEKCL